MVRIGRVASGLTIVAGLAAVAGAVAGCTGGPGAQGGEPGASDSGLERVFGPVYPARPAEGRTVRIDRATLSADRLLLTVEFVGGKSFDPTNPCSEAYEPWVGSGEPELAVAIVELPHGLSVFGRSCTSEGYLHTYGLRLRDPFPGTTVDDAGGGTLLVGARPDTAAPERLPDGWAVRLAQAEEPGPPPIWVAVYAPAPIAAEPPFEGPGRIVLYQAFGVTGEWSDTRAEKSRERGGRPIAVTVSGQRIALWDDPGTGELLLAWTLDGRSMALVGNRADLSPDELVRIAEGVRIP
jgi:hypothetical protein